jgi:flagellar basal-body rod modification protein FlgD
MSITALNATAPQNAQPRAAVQAASTAAPATAASATDGLANESTFLKLLVAQLQHQDPESPADGTQFVAQLAQFSNLEQSIQMRADLDAIKAALTASPAPASAPSTQTIS